MKKTTLLTVLILAGVVLGVLVGHFLLRSPGASAAEIAQDTAVWKTIGEFVLMRPLKLIALPLIVTSVTLGIATVGDSRRLGLLGGATVAYYLATMVLASTLGVLLAATIRPGAGIPDDVRRSALEAGQAHLQSVSGVVTPEGGVGGAWMTILQQLIPDNALRAAVNLEFLSVITICIVTGLGLIAIGSKAKPFIDAVEALHEALMAIVRVILWAMPVGVFCLVAWSVGTMGLGNLAGALAKYVLVVMLGLSFHMLVTLPGALALFGRVNPYRFLWRMRPALPMAFGTASSVATLPVTIETARDHGGCSRRASGLVLPLGATVNMDGTALYQGVAVIFMFQAFGYDLHFAQYLTIVLTATLAAVGAAGIPAGGLVTTIIIISAVNSTIAANNPDIDPLPLAAAIGLIFPVDRALDMVRTMVNVSGDAVGARILTRLAPDGPTDDPVRERALA
ncbi:MAG: dicarboxylate/amino acid:cation symporter [Phycisphaerales bacterium]|nr:dicarboxylate/amino acid:cation symporter [Phycisphaerales bacterium]